MTWLICEKGWCPRMIIESDEVKDRGQLVQRGKRKCQRKEGWEEIDDTTDG